MKKKTITLILLLAAVGCCFGQRTVETQVTLENKSNMDLENYPVTVDISHALEGGATTSALVRLNGIEIPCQLDDIDGDRVADELFFLTTLKKKAKQTYTIVLSDTDAPRRYEPRVYADLMLTNKKIKESNKQDLYISQLTVDRGVNPYWMLHHHGCAFENELVAYRIYFDHRQNIDLYGKKHRRIELPVTQFYTSEEQLAEGYGVDVLWAGDAIGCGSFKDWKKGQPENWTEVGVRGQRVVTTGPLRTVVEVYDLGVKEEDDLLYDMHQYYTLYAGHRDRPGY